MQNAALPTCEVYAHNSLLINLFGLAAGGQQPQQIFSPGQIIRAPAGVLPANLQNLQTVQLSNGQSVAVRPTLPQVRHQYKNEFFIISVKLLTL